MNKPSIRSSCKYRPALRRLPAAMGGLAGAALWAIPATVGAQIYVANWSGNTVGEYTTAGTTVNPTLVSSGLSEPSGLAVSGGNIFIANEGTGKIGEYTTAGAAVNTSLVSGLNEPNGLTIAGGDIYVANVGNGTIGEYTLAGTTVNATLISGLTGPLASPCPAGTSLS
jgi:hypothetical protein